MKVVRIADKLKKLFSKFKFRNKNTSKLLLAVEEVQVEVPTVEEVKTDVSIPKQKNVKTKKANVKDVAAEEKPAKSKKTVKKSNEKVVKNK